MRLQKRASPLSRLLPANYCTYLFELADRSGNGTYLPSKNHPALGFKPRLSIYDSGHSCPDTWINNSFRIEPVDLGRPRLSADLPAIRVQFVKTVSAEHSLPS